MHLTTLPRWPNAAKACRFVFGTRTNRGTGVCAWSSSLHASIATCTGNMRADVQVTPDTNGIISTRPCDLILDANTVIVLDCGTQIFLWLGSNLDLPEDATAAVRRESLRALAAASGGDPTTVAPASAVAPGSLVLRSVHVAHACAVARVPVPELRACREGTGDERYVLSRLAPTTNDDEEDIQAQLPHLAAAYAENAAYTEQMVAHIVRRLPRSDDASLVAWAAQAGVDVRPALHGKEGGGEEDGMGVGSHRGAPQGGIAHARQEAERVSGTAAAAAQHKFRLVAPEAERNPFRGGRRRSSPGLMADPGGDLEGDAGIADGTAVAKLAHGQAAVADRSGGAAHAGALPLVDARGEIEGGALPDQHRKPPGSMSGPPAGNMVASRGGEYAPQAVSDLREAAIADSSRGGAAGTAPPVGGQFDVRQFRPPAIGVAPGVAGGPPSTRPLTGPPPLVNARARPVSAGGVVGGHGIGRPPLVPGPPWSPGHAAGVGSEGGQRAGAPIPPGMQAMQRTRS